MISIDHTHAEGTVVHGTTRSDGTNLVIRAIRDGWRFSRNIGADGAWYLPQSRDRNADRTRIERLAEALHAAGYPVETSIDDTPARPRRSRPTARRGSPGGCSGTPSWPTPATRAAAPASTTSGNAARTFHSASR